MGTYKASTSRVSSMLFKKLRTVASTSPLVTEIKPIMVTSLVFRVAAG
jgi:hypothetical protein